MDYEAAKFWLEVVLVIINALLWLYVYRSNKDKATRDQLDKHAITLAQMEERLKQAVGHPDLKPIYDKINGIADDMAEMRGKLHTLDLIHEMLLHGGK